MKTIITTIIVLTLFVFINAQSPILPLNTDPFEIPEGAYLKDLNNILPQYEGTWQYYENGKTVTLNFQKFMSDMDGFYEDVILT